MYVCVCVCVCVCVWVCVCLCVVVWMGVCWCIRSHFCILVRMWECDNGKTFLYLFFHFESWIRFSVTAEPQKNFQFINQPTTEKKIFCLFVEGKSSKKWLSLKQAASLSPLNLCFWPLHEILICRYTNASCSSPREH